MYSIWFSQQTAIISSSGINRFVFVMETPCCLWGRDSACCGLYINLPLYFYAWYVIQIMNTRTAQGTSAGLLARSHFAPDWPSRHRCSWFPSVIKQTLRPYPELLLRLPRTSPPDLNPTKLEPLLWGTPNYLHKLYNSTLVQVIKMQRPLSQTILTSSLQCRAYQEEE
jgi:hypothetical protein